MAGAWTAVRHGPALGALLLLLLLLHQPNRRAGLQVRKQGLLRQRQQQQRLVQLLLILLLVLLEVLLAVGRGRKGHGSQGQLPSSTSCSSRTLQAQQLRVQQCLGSRRRRGRKQLQQQQGPQRGLR